MIRANITAASLEEWYDKIVAAQQAAHGPNYCAHHHVIRDCFESGADSYCELGVNQGATLACALLARFQRVVGIDISLAPWRPAERLFRAFANEEKTILDLWEMDSRIPVAPVDFLLIDSTHTAAHLEEELDAHADNVQKWILVHDTARADMARQVQWFVSRGVWTVERREPSTFGWMLLRRGP